MGGGDLAGGVDLEDDDDAAVTVNVPFPTILSQSGMLFLSSRFLLETFLETLLPAEYAEEEEEEAVLSCLL